MGNGLPDPFLFDEDQIMAEEEQVETKQAKLARLIHSMMHEFYGYPVDMVALFADNNTGELTLIGNVQPESSLILLQAGADRIEQHLKMVNLDAKTELNVTSSDFAGTRKH